MSSPPLPRLYLSHEPGLDLFSALEFGRVDDGQPGDRWVPVGEHVGLLHDEPDGRCVGFVVKDASAYDPDDPENAELWGQPRFDVPALGLTDVAPNAVFVATRALYGKGQTINRELFSAAIAAKGEEALRRWLRCLQAGDSMAHFALGYTLFELGRLPESYRHLRHYSEIAPGEPWTWTWLGKAAAAMGHDEEARAAFERAIELERDDEETDARELLEALEAGEIEVPIPPSRSDGDDWTEDLDWLLRRLPLGCHSCTDAESGSVVFDVGPSPVWLDIDGSRGALRLRTLIGVVPGLSEADEHATDMLDEYMEDIEEDDGVFVVGDDVWMTTPFDASLADADARTFEILIRGASATGDRIRAKYNSYVESETIEPPPDYETAANRFNEED